MKTVIKFNGKEYIEQDQTQIKLIKARCLCGNTLIIPLACAVLGIVKDCAHCSKDYPAKAHCAALAESYKSLIEGETIVSLD